MDSTLVSDTRGSGFVSRGRQILLTSAFLLCQVLYKTNFPCMYKKTTSTLFYVPSFVQNKFPLHINIKLSLWMYEKTTSAFLENAAAPATAGLRPAAWRARRVGKIQFSVSSPPQCRSQAVVCVSTPRMYPRSGSFLVWYTLSHFAISFNTATVA